MKKIINVFVAVLLFFLIGYAVYSYFVYRKMRNEAQLAQVELNELRDNLKQFKTKNGELVTKLESVEIDKINLKKALTLMGFENKQLKDQDIKWRNIVNALKLEISVIGSGQTTVVDTFKIIERDTLKYMKVNNWTDGFLSIFDGEIINKEFTFEHYYNARLRLVQEHQVKQTIVTAILDDPKASIETGTSITVKHTVPIYKNEKLWGTTGFVLGIIFKTLIL